MASASPASSTERADSPDPASHAATIYDQSEGGGTVGEDSDDMDFEPTDTEAEAFEFFEEALESSADAGETEEEDEDEDEGQFQDAEDGSETLAIQFQADENSPAREGATIHHISRTQLLRLLAHIGRAGRLQALGNDPSDQDEDEAENIGQAASGSHQGVRRLSDARASSPAPPNSQGKVLMASGTFGRNDYFADISRKHKPKLSQRVLHRELGLHSGHAIKDNNLMAQTMIPSSTPDTIIHYNSRCYSGQFSDDGNFFFSCAQDFKVRMYDTSNPYDWKYYKAVDYFSGQWTITDASLSPDNRFLAYSSIKSVVCLAATDPNDDSEPHLLEFANVTGRAARRGHQLYGSFGIYSVRFSGDGRELVAGTGDNSVYVYDIEARKSILRIPGHSDDVNAVCFGDVNSPHILYSGSDDCLLKVWDRRSMADSREAGVFVGHTEGLTFVDSKGDGRYVLSNGKDQTMKLWDLRKMMSTDQAGTLRPQRFMSHFDYRNMLYKEHRRKPNPDDCSVVTFRGHAVLKTLIRCHFSPPGSTNSRYVYTGGSDGSVYIYNMDATLAGKIDVGKATYQTRPRDPRVFGHSWETDDPSRQGSWKTCVRDASWHPNAPVIAATSWNGWEGQAGTCTVHSWTDGLDEDEAMPQMGRRVDPKLMERPEFYGETVAPRRARVRVS